MLIGRAAPLEFLTGALDETRAGNGQTILLAGEAGIGKSRLVRETTRLAIERDFFILQGRCFEQDRALPYAPWIDLLRAFLRERAGETFHHGETFHRNVSTLLRELTSPSPPPLDAEQAKRRLFQTLFEFLALQTPRVVVIEDLHWADEVTLEFLLFVARVSVGDKLLVLLTYRADELNPTLTHFLAALERERLANEIVVSPLTRQETDALVRALFPQPQPVRADFLDALYARTEGNPFFIEETLRTLVNAGDIFLTHGGWERKPLPQMHIPRTVQDAVWARTAAVADSTREILQLAAVAGRRFDFELLRAVTGQTEGQVLSAIKELQRAQLVVEESAEQFAFRHALLREAVYAQLLARERRAGHCKIFETLRRVDENAVEARVAELAYHAFEGELWTRAAEFGKRAGDAARGLFAPQAAIMHYTRALEALERLTPPSPAGELYHQRATQHELVGEFDAARADYETALALAENTADGNAQWELQLALGFLWTARDYTRAHAYLQRALALAHTLDDAVTLAHTLNRMGNWYANQDEPAKGLRLHQQAATLFESLADARGLAETFDLMGTASYFDGAIAQGARYYQRALSQWRALKAVKELSSSLVMFATRGANYLHEMLVLPSADWDASARARDDAVTLARQSGSSSGEAFALIYKAFGLGPLGSYGEAFASAEAGLRLALEMGHAQWNLAARMALGLLYLDVLLLDEAQQQLEEALRVAQTLGSRFTLRTVTSCLARVYVAQKKWSHAARVMDAGLDTAAPMRTQAQRLMWGARIELAVARGEYARALAWLEQMRGAAKGSGVIPRAWKLRGEALLGLQRVEEADAALRDAQTVAAEQNARPLLWRIQLLLGQVQWQQGKRKAAAQEFARAGAEIETLAENFGDAARRETFLAAARKLLPRERALTPNRAAQKQYGGLTTRERQVTALLTQGKTNREIAQALVVSERTVEGNVSSILSKLGFTSRTQIAAWGVEKGLRAS